MLAVLRRLSLPFVAVLLALAGCGQEDSPSTPQQGGGSDRAAVEKAARDYIVQDQADEDDSERPDVISFTKVRVGGDEAEVEAKSSLTGNRYEVTMRKQGARWAGATLLTDRPSETATSQGDPSQGSGREVSTREVEAQIEARLLKPLRLEGNAECPPTVKLRRGNNFECKVTGAKNKTTVTVTQKDDQGNLNFKVTSTP